MEDDSFARFLEKAIARSGKSRERVAADLRARGFKINRSTLLRWEKGDTRPSRKKLPLLRYLPRVLGISAGEQAAFEKMVSRMIGGGFVPAEPPEHRLHFLGGQIVWFAGRKRELAALAAAVNRRQSVLITGMGGAGKTTLARKLLEAEAAGFRHGCDAVRLAPRQPAGVVIGLAARRLGLPLPLEQMGRDADLVISRLQERFAHLDMLFLLDNVDFAGQALPLLTGLPNITWLLTSRRRLFLPDPDVVYQHLDLPDEETAVHMVLHYAGAQLAGANKNAARQIANRLGRLPIALRAAGGLVVNGSLPDLTRLNDWLQARSPAGLKIDDWEIGRFFDDVLAQSRIPGAADLLLLCGLFAAPVIRREAFTAVAGSLGWLAAQADDFFHSLLVERENNDETFSLHSLLYEYAAGRVRQDARYRQMCLKFADYYAAYAACRRDDAAALSVDFANISLAFEYAFSLKEWQLVGRLWGPVTGQLWRMSQWSAYLDINEKTLQAARLTNDWHMQAKTLTAIGWIHLEEVRYDQAEAVFLQAKELCETRQNSRQLVYLCRYLGILHTETGCLGKAERWLREAEARVWRYLGAAGRSADWINLSLSMICHAQAEVSQMRGTYHLAQRWSEKALAVALASPHPYDVAVVPMIRLRLGDIFYRQNDLSRSAGQWRSVMAANAQYPPERRIVAGAMLRLAQLEMMGGGRQAALDQAYEARQIYRQSGLGKMLRQADALISRMESVQDGRDWAPFELWD